MTYAAQGGQPADIPAEVDRWNWGAFLLTWIWGVGNGVLVSLLVFIPFFGILIMPFVLGAKGSAWAWRSRRWDSIEHFKQAQRAWAIWGAALWVGGIVLIVAAVGALTYGLSHGEAYKLGVARLEASAEAVNSLGQPMAAGRPMGSVSIAGDSGHALLTFSAKGPKGQGQVTLEAVKASGVWAIRKLILKLDGRDETIDIVNPTSARRDPASTGAGESPKMTA